jgi:hypothetical protein
MAGSVALERGWSSCNREWDLQVGWTGCSALVLEGKECLVLGHIAHLR